MRLFARDIKGNIKEWNITPIPASNSASIQTGRLGGQLIETIIEHPDITTHIASRIAKKRKEGYVSLKDTGFPNPNATLFNAQLYTWLEGTLTKCNTDANNNLKPMKCQKFKEGVVKYPAIAQPKYNGLRAVLRWEHWVINEGIFAEPKDGAKLRTKEGLEYVLPQITSNLSKAMFQSEIGELVFDGELYIHGKPLNYIKSSCPMTNSHGTISKPSGNPDEVVFVIFDLAIPDILQDCRLVELASLESTAKLWIAPHITISTDAAAMEYRDLCIKQGYEGCVIRETDEEYAFGFRPSFIRKFKTHLDSEFLIVDLIPKPSDDSLPLFILKNDINNEVFECNPTGNWDYQRDLLNNREELIGKFATVRYRERTGTDKKLPFHANVIDIRDKK
jgi:hypothetical protein